MTAPDVGSLRFSQILLLTWLSPHGLVPCCQLDIQTDLLPRRSLLVLQSRLHINGVMPSNGHLFTSLGEAVVEEGGGAQGAEGAGCRGGGGGGVAGERWRSAQDMLPDRTDVPD